MTRPETEDALETSSAAGGRALLSWQSEYLFLAGAVLLVTAIAFAFFYFDLDIAELRKYGYLGIFAISLVGASSIILPMPSIAAIFSGGVLLDPLLGIPTPILVGLAAGLGEALGEFTGYAAGYGGGAFVQQRPFYKVARSWMEAHGTITMLVFSSIPNPIFDVAGVLAGATRMPIWRFFFAVWVGKTAKNMLIAATGVASLNLVEHLFD